MIRLEADLHTHSISSGHAYSTITEIARSAHKKGLKLIAITDHGPNLPGGPHLYYFGNLIVLPDQIEGVNILKGVEANILNNGSLDLPVNILQKLDFVAAGLHGATGHSLKTKSDFTGAIIKAMENPLVRMITHPVNTAFPLDLEEIVLAAKENNVILEINASSYNPIKNSRRGDSLQDIQLARLASRYDVPISLNSDAHFHTEVGELKNLTSIIEKAQLNENDILNTSSHRVLEFLYSTTQQKVLTG